MREPLVMNTYLKITILALCSSALRSQRSSSRAKRHSLRCIP